MRQQKAKRNNILLPFLILLILSVTVLCSCGLQESMTSKAFLSDQKTPEADNKDAASDEDKKTRGSVSNANTGIYGAIDWDDPDYIVSYGDYDQALLLLSDMDNGLADGKTVRIDGEADHIISHYIIEQQGSEDDAQYARIAYYIPDVEDDEYPENGSRILIRGIVQLTDIKFGARSVLVEPENIEVISTAEE